MIHATTWKNLKITMLSERCQIKKEEYKLHDSIYIIRFSKIQTKMQESKSVVAQYEGVWGQGGITKDHEETWYGDGDIHTHTHTHTHTSP